MPFKINEEGWKEMAREIVNKHIVPRMERVADACNEQDGLTEEDGYRVGTEGSGEQLQKHDERATVITATAAAMRQNAKNNTLVKNFHLAGGE
jgi:hypothetical protein